MNLAILGAGSIAGTMAETVNQMKEVNLYAIASRRLEKAEAFAKQYHVEKAYGSYEEMSHVHTIRMMGIIDEVRKLW